MRRDVLDFGHFLLQKGLISEQDLYDAGFVQEKKDLRIGEIARAEGWLSVDDIQLMTFKGYSLLRKIPISFFREALALVGAITEKDFITQLRKFNKAHFSPRIHDSSSGAHCKKNLCLLTPFIDV